MTVYSTGTGSTTSWTVYGRGLIKKVEIILLLIQVADVGVSAYVPKAQTLQVSPVNIKLGEQLWHDVLLVQVAHLLGQSS